MTIPPRQAWLFRLGCWTTFAVALVHVAAHVVVGPELSPHAAAGMSMLQPEYVFPVGGLRQPTYGSVVDGLSLALPLLMGTMGAAGLSVLRHGRDDAKLVRGIAGAFAVGTTSVLVVSVLLFFSVVTFVLALAAMCFGLAAVPEE